MSDLVERLRTERSVYDAELADEAADEIERLRDVLEQIKDMYYPAEIHRIALAALEVDDD